MKRTFVTALVAAAIAAPAIASAPTQLELQLGVEPANYGKFTAAELAHAKAILDTDENEGNARRVVDELLN